MVDIVVVALASPLHVGVYEDGHLVEHIQSTEHTSEALPLLFEALANHYTFQRLFFARGPGSFMSIKISYIFLKTLSIALNIPLYASNGFVFNEGRPIKALRKLYFVQEEGIIKTRTYEEPQEQSFDLPQVLDTTCFSEETEPLYMLPAV